MKRASGPYYYFKLAGWKQYRSAGTTPKKEAEKIAEAAYLVEKRNGHMPSVDVLFDSVAGNVGPNAVGILLTGMGRDGADGPLSMRAAGARTIAQDQATSVVYGMPRVAKEIGAAERVLPLHGIAAAVVDLLMTDRRSP